MSKWPGQPGWDSESYWMGVATTLAFAQADLDSRKNYESGRSTVVLRARLPYLEKPERVDLDRFAKAITELNEDATVLYWRPVRLHGEYIIELVSTEGYLGWTPPGSPTFEQEGWRC